MDIEAYIRDMAARGFSRKAVAAALNIERAKFKEIISYLPDIQWPEPGRSVDQVRAYEDQRGRKYPMTEGRLRAVAAMRDAARAKVTRYTALGVTATLPELVSQFSEVSIAAVRKRLAKGVPLELALTSARSDHSGRKNTVADSHPWKQADRRGYLNYCEKQTMKDQEQQQTIPGQKGHVIPLTQEQRQAGYQNGVGSMNHFPRYTVKGITGLVSELAEQFSSVDASTVRNRLRRGWEVERAFLEPAMPGRERQELGQRSKREEVRPSAARAVANATLNCCLFCRSTEVEVLVKRVDGQYRASLVCGDCGMAVSSQAAMASPSQALSFVEQRWNQAGRNLEPRP
ncbi:TPA: hypothetical protein L3734_005842 [Pseudomonas aeruginosa]|nr:hypothetical protein [Pseudomonas aeruginosa]